MRAEHPRRRYCCCWRWCWWCGSDAAVAVDAVTTVTVDAAMEDLILAPGRTMYAAL